MKGSYLMLIPDYMVIKMMDFVRQNDDVLILEPHLFSSKYYDILNECSVAEVSVDAVGSLGQG